MRNRRIKIIWLISFIAVMIKFGILLLAKQNSTWVESVYSRGFYPVFVRQITRVANVFPFSIGEALIILLLILMLILLVQSIRLFLKKKFGAWFKGFTYFSLCMVLLLTYLDFSWLLNNYRMDIEVMMHLESESNRIEDLEDTFKALTGKTNALRENLSEDSEGLPNKLTIKEILETASQGYEKLNHQYDFIEADPVKVKGLMSSTLQTISGYAGMYMFFVGEPTVNIQAPIFTLPHAAAHEIAHQKGFAQEDTANYLGFLACKNNQSTFFQYSGYISALEYVGSALYEVDPGKYHQLSALYSEKVNRDMQYNYNFWHKAQKASTTKIANEINDRYLKSYNQPEGIKSYDAFVKLLVADYLDDQEV